MKRKRLPPIKYIEPTPEEAELIEKEYEFFRRHTLFFPFPAIPPGNKQGEIHEKANQENRTQARQEVLRFLQVQGQVQEVNQPSGVRGASPVPFHDTTNTKGKPQ